MSSKTLILVRHGQTDWNVARRYQGQTDTLLNATGKAQMGRLAVVLADAVIDRVVASPLARALVSAEIATNAHQLPIFPEPRLMELYLGEWQGKSYGQRTGLDEWFYAAPHGGESGDDFCARLADWLAEVVDGTTLVVVHGLVVQVLLMLACGGTFDDWHGRPIINGAITRIEWNDGEWKLAAFNDDRHLERMDQS